MPPPLSILYLEDSVIDMELSLALLTRAGIEFESRRVETEEQFLRELLQGHHDLILADYALPTFDGVSALKLARQHRPHTPFVFVSGAIGEERAIDSLHGGATDYVLKQRLERLVPAVRRAISQTGDRNARLQAEAEREDSFKREQDARAEAERHARELAQVNSELEQFAYAASHDLQEPLRAVKVHAQLLARRHSALLDADGLECIGFIEAGVSRMQRLIQDLLTYSRISHEHKNDMRPVDLQGIVRRTLADLKALIEENSAQIHIGCLPTVVGDAERLCHVFQNLLSNSLKYRGSQTPVINIDATRHSDGEWIVSVKDNGIGFEQSYADHIFGLFKRLHGSSYPGTGIGLAITRRVIEQHSGRIWAESVPGVGTEFFFTLQPA